MTRGLRYPPFAKPGAPSAKPAPVAEPDLPPIEDFLDELPSIDDFLAFDEPAPESEPALEDYPEEPAAPAVASNEEGWAMGSWQSFDWSSASALNRNTSSAVDSSDAWSESEWPEPVSVPSRSSEHPSADEIADALTGIAHRIRSGELVIDKLQGMPPEAAMAAALAVVLRMRG